MPELRVTLIDVGWGDSILVHWRDGNDQRFGLVDCNDYETERSSLIFVKRYLDRLGIPYGTGIRVFDWVLLTHGHADHARGIKRMISTFGAERFWYPKSLGSTTHATLLAYANRATTRLGHHQAVDSSKVMPALGTTQLAVLWPPHDQVDGQDENRNSVVLTLTLDQVTIVLTGDAEASVWPAITPSLPGTLRVIQVPHHGGRNGVFDHQGNTPWLDHIAGASPLLALSAHVRPHGHPHQDVIAEISARNLTAFRTDTNYHVTFATDGTNLRVEYTH